MHHYSLDLLRDLGLAVRHVCLTWTSDIRDPSVLPTRHLRPKLTAGSTVF